MRASPSTAAIALGAAICGGCSQDPADAPVPIATGPEADTGTAPPGAAVERRGPFLKGQLHAHTWGSRDSSTPPEDVVRWYSTRGYDFLVITDHNRITRAGDTPSMLVLPGVELTINLRACDPPLAAGEPCLLHMDALLPHRPLPFEPWFPLEASVRRDELYRLELAEAQRLGGIPQLNHPNFHFAADATTISVLAREGLVLMEIANEAWDSNNDGDARHPSTEEIWDAVLTAGHRVFGTATDDAHDYFDDPAEAAQEPLAYTGDHAFVMVRAEPDAASIESALVRGDFYATTGLLLDRVDASPERVTVEVATDRPVWLEAVGERGGVLRAEAGRGISFDPRALGSSYVRVRVTDANGRHAWTQPVFIPRSP